MGDDKDQEWRAISEDIVTGLWEWRLQHPMATLAESEVAVDARLARLRAKLLQEAALASARADWSTVPHAERPTCPVCHTPLVARGKQPRRLQASGGRDVVLTRTYGVCPTCDDGLFPP